MAVTFEADFTGDYVVNLADLQIIADHWGYGTNADMPFDEALAGITIPKPATTSLLCLDALMTLRRHTTL